MSRYPEDGVESLGPRGSEIIKIFSLRTRVFFKDFLLFFCHTRPHVLAFATRHAESLVFELNIASSSQPKEPQTAEENVEGRLKSVQQRVQDFFFWAESGVSSGEFWFGYGRKEDKEGGYVVAWKLQ